MKLQRLATIAPAVLLATGCATSGLNASNEVSPDFRYTENALFHRIAEATTDAEKDRRAILAMQGEYRVDFHFQETVALKAGYELRDEKDSGGYEYVHVVEDSPRKIVLQHLLVAPGGGVIKHWRQDWTYEAEERFEFVADQTWQTRRFNAEDVTGTWTQCVFEVSDAPRYCGTGKWNHNYGVSTWTSDRGWRPLPRREYTTRDDYNALNVENRHTVTPNGWTHEQDNTKTIREGRETVATLVREFGFNDYRSIDGYDFSPALTYWSKTEDYWAIVREAWEQRLSPGNTLELTTEVDGMPLIAGTFEQAENAAATSAEEEREAIEELLSVHTRSESSMTSGLEPSVRVRHEPPE
jgi:hypothetical protein